CNPNNNQCKNAGYQRNKNGFAEKLFYQRRFSRTYYFPDTYFLCSFFTAGSAQVHKIDAGNENNKRRNDAEQTNDFNPATRFFSIFKSSIQVRTVQGIKKCLYLRRFLII